MCLNLFRCLRSKFLFSLVLIVLINIHQTSKAQVIDSIELKLSNHLSDTAFLRQSLTQIIDQQLVGSPKADSIAAIIKKQSEILEYQLGIALSIRYQGVYFFNKGEKTTEL